MINLFIIINININMNLPIDIINKILIYTGELDNVPFIIQYNRLNEKKVSYKINPYADYFLSLRALMIVKRLYPLRSYEGILNNTMLYKLSKKHYMEMLKLNDKNLQFYINFQKNIMYGNSKIK